MHRFRLEDGDYLYRAGDGAQAAFVVLAGCIVLVADGSGQSEQRFRPGETFGAVELLTDAPRAADARADGASEVAAYGAAELGAVLRAHPAAVNTTIGALLAALPAPPAPAETAGPRWAANAVRLVALTDTLGRQIGPDGVLVAPFPFVVGRRAHTTDGRGSRQPALTLRDERPYHLSRSHFMIDRTGDTVVVHDCGSYNGTIVNGVRIGTDHESVMVRLETGSNEIVAGLPNSPFRFECVVPERLRD